MSYLTYLLVGWVFLHEIWPECMEEDQSLIKRRETVRLSCTKQMGSARSSMRTTHPFHCPPETLMSLWSCRQFGRSQCCLFCFFVNQQSHPYNAVIKPNQLIITSKARDQLQVRKLIGEEMRAFHCPALLGNGIAYFFIYTKWSPYFSKISFSKLYSLKPSLEIKWDGSVGLSNRGSEKIMCTEFIISRA